MTRMACSSLISLASSVFFGQRGDEAELPLNFHFSECVGQVELQLLFVAFGDDVQSVVFQEVGEFEVGDGVGGYEVFEAVGVGEQPLFD